MSNMAEKFPGRLRYVMRAADDGPLIRYVSGGTQVHEHKYERVAWDKRHGRSFEPIPGDSWFAKYRYLVRCPCGSEMVKEGISLI